LASSNASVADSDLTEQAKTPRQDSQLLEPARGYPGALIVVEGIDGSGKSTQLYLLKRWLEIGGYRLHFTEWNSSPLVKSATRRGKQRRLLTPTTFSLLHRVCSRRSTQLFSSMAAESLSLRARPGHYVLFPGATRRRRESNHERASQAQIL
jgi:hypothetical protein